METLDANLNSEAKSFILNLRKQLEENKKTLQGNSEIQNIIKSAHSTYGDDNSLLYDLESALKKSSATSSKLQINTQNLKQTSKEMDLLNQSPGNKSMTISSIFLITYL